MPIICQNPKSGVKTHKSQLTADKCGCQKGGTLSKIIKDITLTKEIDSNGVIRYYNSRHQLDNPYGPAVIFPDGKVEYYIEDKLHNLYGPAIVYANGNEEYYIDGELSRDPKEGPAVIKTNGYKAYYIHGKLYNPYGPAVIWPAGF